MKLKTGLIISLLLPLVAHPAKWSHYITSQERDDVKVSFRQTKQLNAWTVEWQVDNGSNSTVEPFLNHRKYHCKDKSMTSYPPASLGIFAPNSKHKGDIKDKKVCPNSLIELIEIRTEIIEIIATKDPVEVNHDTSR